MTVNEELSALDVTGPEASHHLRTGLDVTVSDGTEHLRILVIHLKTGCWDRSVKRRHFLQTASIAPVSLAAVPLGASPAFADANEDRGTAPHGVFEVVASFDGPGPSGIVVLPDGRVFVGFPRHAVNHKGATLGELVKGKVEPYPSREESLPSNRSDAECLVSIHGMALDRNGRIWVIDDGKRAGLPIAPGAAKIDQIEVDSLALEFCAAQVEGA